MSKVTLSVIKADVGSIGGHTKPSEPMLDAVRSRVRGVLGNLLVDGLVTCTGDDIAILMSHKRGVGARTSTTLPGIASLPQPSKPKARVCTAQAKTSLWMHRRETCAALVRQSPRLSSSATREAKIARRRRSSFLLPTSAARVRITIPSTPSSATRCITADCS